MKNIILILTLIGFILSQDCNCDCEEPVNTWFKVSTADKDYGEIIELDMENGIATTDGLFIYIIVTEKNTMEELVIAFPIGYWKSEKPYAKKPNIKPNTNEKEEFDLDEYLKNNKNKGIKVSVPISR
jgi:hypothetical protein